MTKSGRNKRLSLANRFTVSSSVTDSSVFQILKGLNTPRSLAVWLLYNSGEHRQLVDLSINPNDYSSPEEFRKDYLATELLSKSTFLNLDIDREAVAVSGHFANESRCKTYNGYFRDLPNHPLYKGDCVYMYHTYTRKIGTILGDCPSFSRLFADCQWGPGATTLTTGSDTSSANKFQLDAGITRDLLDAVFPEFSSEFPGWLIHIATDIDFQLFVGNKVTTVEKNAKTNRLIAIEPGINSFIQKGIGRDLEKRLYRSCGVTLRDQTVNQRLAQRALANNCATIDMRSASSLICVEMLRESIPEDWYSLLNTSRSQYGVLDGTVFRWENFSSMGNGFTFPLQSILFYAAAYAACDLVGARKDLIGVFGDDLILPVDAVPSLFAFLDFLGLEVNKKKSFFSSLFRESCGSHWFANVDVKPIYLKDRLTTLDTIFTLANKVRRWAKLPWGLDPTMYTCWRYLFTRVPKILRFFADEGNGDVGFHVDFDMAAPVVDKVENYVEGYFCVVCSRVGRTREHFGYGLLLAKLSSTTERATRNRVSLRQRTVLRIHRVLVRHWRDRKSVV